MYFIKEVHKIEFTTEKAHLRLQYLFKLNQVLPYSHFFFSVSGKVCICLILSCSPFITSPCHLNQLNKIYYHFTFIVWALKPSLCNQAFKMEICLWTRFLLSKTLCLSLHLICWTKGVSCLCLSILDCVCATLQKILFMATSCWAFTTGDLLLPSLPVSTMSLQPLINDS